MMYLPSVRASRSIDRDAPELPLRFWRSIALVSAGHMLSRRGRGWSVSMGLGTAVLVMAAPGSNDLFGKYIGPLAMVNLVAPAPSVGVDLSALREGSLPGAALLLYSAVANTLLMNLPLWPVPIWGLRHS
jgi:hypothetical protein